MRHTLYVGLDAGGSKTHVVAAKSDLPPHYSSTVSGIHLQRMDTDECASRIADAVRSVCSASGDFDRTFVCAGVAGAGRRYQAAALEQSVYTLVGTDLAIQVVHDGIVALEGALEGQSGAIIIAGTGSLVFAKDHSHAYRRIGGWGYILGDDGSGRSIGVAALREVARTLDAGKTSDLRSEVMKLLGGEDVDALIQAVYRDGFPPERLAPVVLDLASEGDSQAGAAVKTEIDGLVRQAEILDETGPEIARKVALLGGLTENVYYATMLRTALEERMPAWAIIPPAQSPALGALLLARRLKPR